MKQTEFFAAWQNYRPISDAARAIEFVGFEG